MSCERGMSISESDETVKLGLFRLAVIQELNLACHAALIAGEEKNEINFICLVTNLKEMITINSKIQQSGEIA